MLANPTCVEISHYYSHWFCGAGYPLSFCCTVSACPMSFPDIFLDAAELVVPNSSLAISSQVVPCSNVFLVSFHATSLMTNGSRLCTYLFPLQTDPNAVCVKDITRRAVCGLGLGPADSNKFDVVLIGLHTFPLPLRNDDLCDPKLSRRRLHG